MKKTDTSQSDQFFFQPSELAWNEITGKIVKPDVIAGRDGSCGFCSCACSCGFCISRESQNENLLKSIYE